MRCDVTALSVVNMSQVYRTFDDCLLAFDPSVPWPGNLSRLVCDPYTTHTFPGTNTNVSSLWPSIAAKTSDGTTLQTGGLVGLLLLSSLCLGAL